jgi:hypothetical protein
VREKGNGLHVLYLIGTWLRKAWVGTDKHPPSKSEIVTISLFARTSFLSQTAVAGRIQLRRHVITLINDPYIIT